MPGGAEEEWRRRLLASLPLRYRQHHAMYTWGEDWGESGGGRRRPDKVTSETYSRDQKEAKCTCVPPARREWRTHQELPSPVSRMTGDESLASKRNLSRGRLERIASSHHLPRPGIRRHPGVRLHYQYEHGDRWGSQQQLDSHHTPPPHTSQLFRSLSDPEILTSSYKDTVSDKTGREYETQEAVFESFDHSSCESFSFRDRLSSEPGNNDTAITHEVSLVTNEELISLCHIEESMTKHCYTASRGQREREMEWLELVPSRLLVRNTKRIIQILD